MRTKIVNLAYYSVALLSLISWHPMHSFAEDAKVQYYVQSPAQRVLNKPHGNEIATANLRTPVEVLEETDGWVKVAIIGWMREASLASNLSAAKVIPQVALTTEPLTIVDFDLKHVSRKESGNPSKVILTLKIKNQNQFAIQKWDAILIAQDTAQNFLFRTRITPEQTKLKPGETGDFRYFWTYDQEIYEYLVSKDKTSVRFFLHNIVIE